MKGNRIVYQEAVAVKDKIHWVDHPLIQHKLTLMRRKDQSTAGFRQLAS